MKDLLSKVLPQGKFWTDAWSLVEGCTPVSPGCKNCWLAGIGRRFQSCKVDPKTGHFNGKVVCREDRLDIPLRARKPRVYAIWSDLFHESVPFTFILKVLTTMALAPHHRFIVVTKRSKRCADILAGDGGWSKERWQTRLSREAYDLHGELADVQVHNAIEGCLAPNYNLGWPLSNVTILVTMEDQQRADERAPYALQLAAMGWRIGALCEPLLGPIEFSPSALNPFFESLFWIITGGESGHNARPAHPDWFRSLRDQAQAAGVPFLFKQWGEWGFSCNHGSDDEECRGKKVIEAQPTYVGYRVGKKAAGRTLDGREWLEVPE